MKTRRALETELRPTGAQVAILAGHRATRPDSPGTVEEPERPSPAESPTPRHSRSVYVRRRIVVILLLILALAATTRILAFKGVAGWDDLNYARTAHFISVGEYSQKVIPQATHELAHYSRLGLILPTALMIRIFGMNEFALSVYPMLCSLLLVLLAYAIGENLLGAKEGLIAALVIALFPLEVIDATLTMPDIPSMFWFTLSLYLIIRYEKKQGRPRRWLYLLGSGLSFGIAYMHRETVVYCGLLIVAYFIYKIISERRVDWTYSFLLLGFLAVLTAETLFFYATTGDALFRLHCVQVHIDTEVSVGFFKKYSSVAGFSNVLKRLTIDYFRMFFQSPKHFALIMVATAIGFVYCLLKRIRKSYIVLAWFLALLVILDFATSSLKAYAPLGLNPRYFAYLDLPAALIIAASLVFMFRRLPETEKTISNWRIPSAVAAIALVIGVSAVVFHSTLDMISERVYEAMTFGGRAWEDQFNLYGRVTFRVIIASFIVMLVMLCLAYYLKNGGKLRFPLTLIGAVMIVLLAVTPLYTGIERKRFLNERKIAEYIQEHPGEPVYGDVLTLKRLAFFTGTLGTKEEERLRLVGPDATPQNLEGLVVLSNAYSPPNLKKPLEDLPLGWSVVYRPPPGLRSEPVYLFKAN